MKRNCSLEEISDGRLYSINDMVRADCQDCKGCSDCCKGMGESIVLDPYDVYRLKKGLNTDFNGLLSTCMELNVFDGIILPNLRLSGKDEKCTFLNAQGRCDIHQFRPGICRLFPLGRYYENGGHKYFLQIYECTNKSRSKIKVSKWIDTPELKTHEKYIDEWHYFLKTIQDNAAKISESDLKNINMYILNQFYVTMSVNENFYQVFCEKLKCAKESLNSITDI